MTKFPDIYVFIIEDLCKVVGSRSQVCVDRMYFQNVREYVRNNNYEFIRFCLEISTCNPTNVVRALNHCATQP